MTHCNQKEKSVLVLWRKGDGIVKTITGKIAFQPKMAVAGTQDTFLGKF